MNKIKEKVLEKMLEDTKLSRKEKKLIAFDSRVERVIDLTLIEVKKIIDDFKEGEEMFDLHIRGCKIDDIGGITHDACDNYKIWVMNKLKQKLLEKK